MTGHLLLSMLLAIGGFADGHAIQPPGEFHGDEPVARDGEHWLALRRDALVDEASLVPVTLVVAAVEDAVLDQAGQRTGRSVQAREGHDDVVMFLRGGQLVPGPVATAAIEPLANDGPHRIEQAIEFEGLRHALRSDCLPAPAAPGDTQQRFDCAITLEAGGRTQVLVRMGGYAERDDLPRLGDDASPAVLFAGDLDGDGRLDLLFDTTDHYNLSRPTLFLSAPAQAGELVREVARFESVGC